MIVRLGYVAIPLTLNITCSSTITYTNYQKLTSNERKKKLDFLIRSNLENLERVLTYNKKNNIHFYRITSKLLPLVTHKSVHYTYYKPYQNFYLRLGNIIKKDNIRVDFHPDQFAILNSEKEEVVNNTFCILKYHYHLFKMMGIDDGKLVLHVGSIAGGKEEALKRFEDNFYKLPLGIRNSIVLENDDKVFGIIDVLKLCQKLKIPMVLDYHHFLCNNKGEFIEDYLSAIFDTWLGTNLLPKIHFSTPKNNTKKDFRSHSEYINGQDFINFLEILKKKNQDVDIMIEAKGKDRALFDLIRQIKYLTSYKFIDDTTFII